MHLAQALFCADSSGVSPPRPPPRLSALFHYEGGVVTDKMTVEPLALRRSKEPRPHSREGMHPRLSREQVTADAHLRLVERPRLTGDLPQRGRDAAPKLGLWTRLLF